MAKIQAKGTAMVKATSNPHGTHCPSFQSQYQRIPLISGVKVQPMMPVKTAASKITDQKLIVLSVKEQLIIKSKNERKSDYPFMKKSCT